MQENSACGVPHSLGGPLTAGNPRAIGPRNVFTNLMAARNLREAAACSRRCPDVARRLGVDEAEMSLWCRAAEAMVIPYFEPLTVRDSSLSASTQAVLAAEVGHLDLAYDYLAEAALADLHDTQRNVLDGLHIASVAGAWIGVVAGFGGLRVYGQRPVFAHRLPPGLGRILFRMRFRASRFCVEIRPGEATYRLISGPAMETGHHGRSLALTRDQPVTLPIPPAPERRSPRQPPCRAPVRRRPR